MFSSEQYPQVDIICLTVQMKKLKNRELQIYLTKFVQLKSKRKKEKKKKGRRLLILHIKFGKFSLRA